MIKYTFSSHVSYKGQAPLTITHTVETESLNDLLEAFACFLAGCGFHVPGPIDFVEQPE